MFRCLMLLGLFGPTTGCLVLFFGACKTKIRSLSVPTLVLHGTSFTPWNLLFNHAPFGTSVLTPIGAMSFLQIKESQSGYIATWRGNSPCVNICYWTILKTSNEFMVFIYFHEEEIHAWKEGIEKSLLIMYSMSKVEKITLWNVILKTNLEEILRK